MTDSWRTTEKTDTIAVLRVTDSWRTTEKSVTKGDDLRQGEGAPPLNFYEGRIDMTKKRAIEIISQAAVIYQDLFCEKNFLIIYGNESSPEYIETKSLPRNFLHLTGVKLNKKISGNTAERFFNKAFSHILNENDFEFKKGSTEQKLSVLIQTLDIKSNARMIGDFSGNRFKLKTDKVAGGANSFLGFLKVDGNYVPNTVIEGDIRKDSYFPARILGVLIKEISDPNYRKSLYFAKKIDFSALLDKIKVSVPIDKTAILGALRTPSQTGEKKATVQQGWQPSPNTTKNNSTESFSTNDFKGTLRPALAGADGAAVALDFAQPPRDGLFFESVKKFFSGLAKPFKTYIEKRRELKAARAEINLLEDNLGNAENKNALLQVKYDLLSSDFDKKSSEYSEKIEALKKELDSTKTELESVKADLKSVTELSDKRDRLLREANQILNDNPGLKSEYIRARDEHRNPPPKIRNDHNKPDKPDRGKPKHSR